MVFVRYDDLESFVGDSYALIQSHPLQYEQLLLSLAKARALGGYADMYAAAAFDGQSPMMAVFRGRDRCLHIISISIPDRLPWDALCADVMMNGGFDSIEGEKLLVAQLMKRLTFKWDMLRETQLIRMRPAGSKPGPQQGDRRGAPIWENKDESEAIVGELKLASFDELYFLPEWFASAFGGTAESWVGEIRLRLGQSQIFLWEVGGRPTSMVTCERFVEHIAMLTDLYTSPVMRGQGQAVACLRAFYKYIWEQGGAGCAMRLSMDVNPNWIRRIDGRLVSSSEHWRAR